jgi:glycosyltransferase involved in cell wall biosynthesis
MLVLTSDDEGVPNVVLEAMAAGLPVVATPAGDTPDIVEDGVTGLIVPFGDANAIADRIVALCASPQRRRQLGEAGRERLAHRYRVDGLGERMLDLYRSIDARKAHPRRSAVDAPWR